MQNIILCKDNYLYKKMYYTIKDQKIIYKINKYIIQDSKHKYYKYCSIYNNKYYKLINMVIFSEKYRLKVCNKILKTHNEIETKLLERLATFILLYQKNILSYNNFCKYYRYHKSLNSLKYNKINNNYTVLKSIKWQRTKTYKLSQIYNYLSTKYISKWSIVNIDGVFNFNNNIFKVNTTKGITKYNTWSKYYSKMDKILCIEDEKDTKFYDQNIEEITEHVTKLIHNKNSNTSYYYKQSKKKHYDYIGGTSKKEWMFEKRKIF